MVLNAICFALGSVSDSGMVAKTSIIDTNISKAAVIQVDTVVKPVPLVKDEESESFTIEKPVNDENDNAGQASESQMLLKQDSSVSETLVVKSGEELVQKHNSNSAFYSLLLPGWGEYKMGKKTLGKSLMLTDGVFWIGLGVTLYVKSLIMDDLRSYLYAFGDCNGKRSPSGRSAWDLDDKELELPLYVDSSADYEQRIYKPSRDTSMLKIDFYWQWDNEATHQRYYDLWRNANQTKVTAYYFLGAAVVTRVASFVTARYFLKNESVNTISGKSISLDIKPALIKGNKGVLLSLRF